MQLEIDLKELKGFKFVRALVLELKKKKKKMMIKQNIAPFIQTQKQKHLLMKVTLMMYLNQSIVLLYQACRSLEQKVQVGLLIQF